jgi:hypothetical protein
MERRRIGPIYLLHNSDAFGANVGGSWARSACACASPEESDVVEDDHVVADVLASRCLPTVHGHRAELIGVLEVANLQHLCTGVIHEVVEEGGHHGAAARGLVAEVAEEEIVGEGRLQEAGLHAVADAHPGVEHVEVVLLRAQERNLALLLGARRDGQVGGSLLLRKATLPPRLQRSVQVRELLHQLETMTLRQV